jgi:glycosyltransferase involved in cell wall biosynthesis
MNFFPPASNADDVSVVIPVYNRVRMLKRAIQSVLSQTIRPREILVIDDGSDDALAPKIAKMAALDPIVRVLRQPVNRGAANARNRGFRAATGRYIALLDSDDCWMPEKLQRQLDAMRRLNARITTTAYWLNSDNTSAASTRAPPGQEQLRCHECVHDVRNMVWGCRSSPGSTAMFERALLEEVGDQNENLARLEDWDWLIRVAKVTRIPALSEPLTRVFIQGRASVSTVDSSISLLLRLHLSFFAKRNPFLAMQFLSTCLIEIAAANFFAGRRFLLMVYGIGAFICWPFRNTSFFIRAFGLLKFWGASDEPGHTQASTKKMLHVISSLEAGGAEKMLTNLTAAAQQMAPEHAVTHIVVALRPGGKYEDEVRSNGIELHVLGLERLWHVPATILTLRALIKKTKPDAIKSWMYHANLVTWFAARLPPAASGKLIWGIRCSDMDLSKYPLALKISVRINGILSGTVDRLVVNNYEGLRHHQEMGFASQNWAILNNGAREEWFAAAATTPKRQAQKRFGLSEVTGLKVGTSARFDAMKGYPTFLSVLEDRPDFVGLAIGSGTKALPDLPNLIALGLIEDIPLYLRSLDVFVLCSYFGEGFSNSLLEAMMMGLPIVATDVGDNARVIGASGIIIPPRNSDALRSALDYLASAPDEAARLGANAKDRACRLFPISQTVKDLYDIAF